LDRFLAGEPLAKLYRSDDYLAPWGRPNDLAGFFLHWPEGSFANGSMARLFSQEPDFVEFCRGLRV
jgi:hypothetical protein